jgi:hypothetical protein
VRWVLARTRRLPPSAGLRLQEAAHGFYTRWPLVYARHHKKGTKTIVSMERIAAEIYEGLSVDAARRVIEFARKARNEV